MVENMKIRQTTSIGALERGQGMGGPLGGSVGVDPLSKIVFLGTYA